MCSGSPWDMGLQVHVVVSWEASQFDRDTRSSRIPPRWGFMCRDFLMICQWHTHMQCNIDKTVCEERYVHHDYNATPLIIEYNFSGYLTLMQLVANLVNSKWCKNPEKWCKSWQMGTFQWIPTWQGLNDFHNIFLFCALDESNVSCRRVKGELLDSIIGSTFLIQIFFQNQKKHLSYWCHQDDLIE